MELPDPVLAVPPDERAARMWGGDPLLQVQGVGAFVRVLLPIRLTEAAALTVGTWLAIDPARLTGVWERWETDAYATLELEGYLAKAIPPWGDRVLGAPAIAAVIDPSSFPCLRSSPDAMLDDILTRTWPHDAILDAYASVR
jgi:hypothetical protein